MDIYEAIAKVMEEIGAVGKTSLSDGQKYKYRGIDAVMSAVNPALLKHKVFVVPNVLEEKHEELKTRNGNLIIYSILKVKYTFFAEDGSYIESVVVGEGMDSGDKASNKAMAAAYKYALLQTLCIPTEEMLIDSETESPEPIKEKPITQSQMDTINKLAKKTGSGIPLKNGKTELSELTATEASEVIAEMQKGTKKNGKS